MKIGVLKEQKTEETRVALLPIQCEELVQAGHKVFVETNAGAAIHLQDQAYEQAGAKIIPVGEAVKTADLILGIKYPPKSYLAYLNEKKLIMTYFHLDENTPQDYAEALRLSHVTGIAYEWVGDGKNLPLLEPMSKIAGALFAFKGLELLLRYKTKIPLSYYGHRPKVMVVGIGRMGRESVRVFEMNGCELIIVDKHPDTLGERIGNKTVEKSCVVEFNAQKLPDTLNTIRQQAQQCDIVLLAAVRRPDLPKTLCEYILRKDDVSAMQPGSVVMDATACIRDFIETAIPSEKLDMVYQENGIIHYNPDHIPALAGITSSQLLTEATFPYIKKVADQGKEALLSDSALRNGVVVYRGTYTHKHTCNVKNYPYTPLP